MKEIEALTAKGVTAHFYNCEETHLHHTIPYDAESFEDVHIRIYTDSTKKDIILQIEEAKRNLVKLIDDIDDIDIEDMSECSDLYRHLYVHLNFTRDDLDLLETEVDDEPDDECHDCENGHCGSTAPNTVEEAVDALMPRFKGMEDVFKRDIDNFASFCHSQLSGGIGMQIRNEYGFWSSQRPNEQKTDLYVHMIEELKFDPTDADAMSDHILREVYKKWNAKKS